MRPWVVEYSATQRCCHVDLLEDALQKNRQAIEAQDKPDFVPIGIFPDAESAGVQGIEGIFGLK